MVDYTGSLTDSVVEDSNQKDVTSVEQLSSRSWDRENIVTRLEEVENNRGMIESILQDIDEEFEDLPTHDELKEEWKAYLERIETDSKGRPKKLPRAFSDVKKDKIDLMIRQAVWQARAKELESFARKKVGEKFSELLEEYRTGKSYDKLEDVLENKAEHFATEKVEKRATEIESKISQLEKLGQAMREERRSDRETIKTLAEAADGVDEEKVKGLVEEASENGLEQFVTKYGVFELDESKLSDSDKDQERQSAARSAAEDAASDLSDQNVFELEGKSVEEQFEVLNELAEEVEPMSNGFSESDVADYVDVSEADLFRDGGILDKIQDEDMFPPVDVR